MSNSGSARAASGPAGLWNKNSSLHGLEQVQSCSTDLLSRVMVGWFCFEAFLWNTHVSLNSQNTCAQIYICSNFHKPFPYTVVSKSHYECEALCGLYFKNDLKGGVFLKNIIFLWLSHFYLLVQTCCFVVFSLQPSRLGFHSEWHFTVSEATLPAVAGGGQVGLRNGWQYLKHYVTRHDPGPVCV